MGGFWQLKHAFLPLCMCEQEVGCTIAIRGRGMPVAIFFIWIQQRAERWLTGQWPRASTESYNGGEHPIRKGVLKTNCWLGGRCTQSKSVVGLQAGHLRVSIRFCLDALNQQLSFKFFLNLYSHVLYRCLVILFVGHRRVVTLPAPNDQKKWGGGCYN